MALFKISQGASSDLNSQTLTEGFCWFTPDDGKFYIDAKKNNVLARIPLNAEAADFASNGFYYGECETEQETQTKTVTVDSNFALATGVVVLVKFTYASAAATMSLNVNGTGAHSLKLYGTTDMSSTVATTGWTAGAVVPFVYDGTNWVRFYWQNTTYTITSVYSGTAASTAAKATSNSSYYALRAGNYFEITMRYSNTVKSALTLKVGSTTAKPIYINGTASSASNYTLPAGKYIVYYDGTAYHFRTDGKIPGNLAGNADTATTATTAATANSVAWANVSDRPGNVSDSASGLMTVALYNKLAGIESGAEVNQNAFSNVKVGSTTIVADTKTDTLELAGSNVTLIPDATNDKVTIGITQQNVIDALGYTPPTTNTTYENATQSAAGLMSAADKKKLDGVATGAEVNQNAFGKVAVSGQTTVEADEKIDTLNLAGSNVTLTTNASTDTVTIGITSANVTAALGYTPPQQDTTYNTATTTSSGLMSSDDKTKLNGIESGAEVNQNAFSNIKVGSTTVEADAKTDTVEFVGSNITITPDATNDKVTFSLTSSNVTTALGYTPPQQNTTYSAGTGLSLSGTTFNHSNSVTAQNTQALYPVKIDAQGHISAYGTAVTSLPASDVSAWAKAANKPTYTASEVGAVATSAVGAANGVAPLNASSKIDEAYLPSYVDDVVEGYYYNNKFYQEAGHTTEITGEAGKIYVDLATNKVYRYGGTAYAELSSGSVVSVSRDLTSGTKSATITVNGTGYDIYSVTNTDKEVKQSLSTSNSSYAVLLRADTGTTTSTGEAKFSSNVTIQPSTGDITAGKINGYTLADASAKSVDTSISAGSSSANLPTSAAVASFVEGKGYITGYTETDPAFSASAAAGITSSDITNWNSKTSNTGTVTKVTAGTGLKIGTASSGGDITTTGTINHINSVTAQNTQALYPIKIDAQGHISAYGTAVTSLPASDVSAWAKAATKPTYTASEVGALPDTTTIPSNTSDLINDSGFITGMYVASYGNSTYADVLAAYQANKIVYCRASSAADPSTGSQTRMAFLAYVNNVETPTTFEFQYYRSVSTHTEAQQGDQIFIYTLTSAGTWTVATRNASSNVVAGTGLSTSYSNGTITLSVDNNTDAITGVEVNNVALSIDNDGVVSIPNASTGAYGVVQLSDSTSSTSTSLAATANAVRLAYNNGGVQSVNTYTGDVVLTHDDVGVYQGTTAPASMASQLNTGDIYVYTPGTASGTTYSLDENMVFTGDVAFSGTVSGLTAEDVHIYVGTTAPASMASQLSDGDIYIYLSAAV